MKLQVPAQDDNRLQLLFLLMASVMPEPETNAWKKFSLK